MMSPEGTKDQGRDGSGDLGTRGLEHRHKAGGMWPQVVKMLGAMEPRGMLGVRDIVGE